MTIAIKGVGKILKHIRDKYMHQVPTGPHTDVKKYKVNPSLKAVPKVVLPKLVNPKSGQKTAPPLKRK